MNIFFDFRKFGKKVKLLLIFFFKMQNRKLGEQSENFLKKESKYFIFEL